MCTSVRFESSISAPATMAFRTVACARFTSSNTDPARFTLWECRHREVSVARVHAVPAGMQNSYGGVLQSGIVLPECCHHTAARTIIAAEYAAPNPLSMFTTETFGEQEFSIPSSAARPPKAAP